MPLKLLSRTFALALIASPWPVFACSGQLHIEIEHSGVYALDYAAVVAAQPTLADCKAADLVLTGAGKEIPLRIAGDAEAFGPGSRIEWIGRQLHGPESWYDPFSINNVYLLGASPGTHARMTDAGAAGGTRGALERELHIEEENQFIRLDQQQQKPGEESDVWQWAKLTQIDPTSFSTTFDLPDLASRGDVALAVNFRGLSELTPNAKYKGDRPTDHAVEVRINGKLVSTLGWSGRDEIKREIKVPASILKARANALVLTVPKRKLPWDEKSDAIDVVMFNWLEARYPIAGDLDAGALPFKLAGDAAPELSFHGKDTPVLYGSDGKRRIGTSIGAGRYRFAAADAGVEMFPALDNQLAKPVSTRAVAVHDWQKDAAGYDYLIVSHPSLIDAIKPLAEFHEKRGLKVAVLDVDEVYDQFNFGVSHPRAIRNLVDRAWHDWPTQPRFLLLVGDSSYDIRHDTYNDLNYAKWTNQELLYPNHFGAIGGTPYKNQPKKLADRNLIPTWQYPSPEGQSASDNWFGSVDGDDWHPVVAVGRFPVVTPDEVKAIVAKTIDYISKPQLGAWRRDVMFITDEIDAFKQASNQIATALGQEGFVADKVYASPKESDNLAHQNAIRQGIDDGRLIVHFIGHGGRYIWRTGPPDLRKNHDLFTLDDVGSLKNASRLPMVLSMTCYSAPFDNPAEDSIGERFLREPDKGAIAVFAASWRNAPSPAFSKSIIDELLKPGATIGEAIVRAKKKSADRTLVEMYNLLGDPAVVLERPRDDARVVRDGDRWDPGVIVDLERSRFSGNIAVDWLDAKGNKLGSNAFVTQEARFRLPVPSFANGTATEVRVYAASPATGRDAIGGTSLVPPKPKSWTAALMDRWRDLTRPPYKPPPRTADTITQRGFDDPTPERAVAGAKPASGSAAAANGSN